jgi:hypothetical protein
MYGLHKEVEMTKTMRFRVAGLDRSDLEAAIQKVGGKISLENRQHTSNVFNSGEEFTVKTERDRVADFLEATRGMQFRLCQGT